jgi:hypothetical protein
MFIRMIAHSPARNNFFFFLLWRRHSIFFAVVDMKRPNRVVASSSAASVHAGASSSTTWSSARAHKGAPEVPAAVKIETNESPSLADQMAAIRAAKSMKWVLYQEVARIGDIFERHAHAGAAAESATAARPYTTLVMAADNLPCLLECMFFTFDASTVLLLQTILVHDTSASAIEVAAPSLTSPISFPVFIDWLPTMEQLQRRLGATAKSKPTSVDWAKLRQQLPTGLSPEDEQRRDILFTRCDPNGNGFLSLAEIDKALRDELRISEIFDCKPVIMRAFQAARASVPPRERNHNGDYVTRATFRVLLFYLKEYFELWQIFTAADTSGDRRIDKGEFANVFSQLKDVWGLEVGAKTAEEAFREVDVNNGGFVLFDEFAHWALLKNLSAD